VPRLEHAELELEPCADRSIDVGERPRASTPRAAARARVPSAVDELEPVGDTNSAAAGDDGRLCIDAPRGGLGLRLVGEPKDVRKARNDELPGGLHLGRGERRLARAREERQHPPHDVHKTGDELAARIVGRDEAEREEECGGTEQRAIDTPQRRVDVRLRPLGEPDDREGNHDL